MSDLSQHTHQCPYCELRFSYTTEVYDHIVHDHPNHAKEFSNSWSHELPDRA